MQLIDATLPDPWHRNVTVPGTVTLTVADALLVLADDPMVAVTVAASVVTSPTVARPLTSVMAKSCVNVPPVVENTTDSPGRPLPDPSSTVAVIDTVPPLDGTRLGFALIVRPSAAAAPITTSTALVVAPPSADVPAAAPETARTDATPETLPALSVALATPPTVRALAGAIDPSVVVNRTCVPSCTGVPACSSTTAVISTVPPSAEVWAPADNAIVDPVGASSGIVSQAASARPPASTPADTAHRAPGQARMSRIVTTPRTATRRAPFDPSRSGCRRRRPAPSNPEGWAVT